MILITGSLAFDYIFNFPGKFGDHIMPEKIHEINISFIVKKFSKRFGGTAGNMAYNLSLLGIKPTLLATVGNDFREYRSWLLKNKISLKYLKTYKNENSSTGFVMNDMADNQIWGYSYGALRHSKNLSLKMIKEPVDILIISANDPDSFLNFQNQAINLKISYMYDFGMMLTGLGKKDLINGVINSYILIGNDYEMARLFKITGLKKKEVLGKVHILITTLGEKGSVIETKNQKIKINIAHPFKLIDPTGAGDAYRAGFLAGWQKGYDLKTCGRIGSVASSFAIEKYGTQEHRYSIEEFKSRFMRDFNLTLKL